MKKSHSDTLSDIINALYKEFNNDIRVFKRQVGKFKIIDKKGITRWIKVGEVGQCDLYGWFKGGKAFEIEVKVENDVLKEEQKKWRDICINMNVGWFLYRNNMKKFIEYMRGIK